MKGRQGADSGRGRRYNSASDVIRSGLRLLEEHEARVQALQGALRAGLESGQPQPFDFATFKARKHAEHTGQS